MLQLFLSLCRRLQAVRIRGGLQAIDRSMAGVMRTAIVNETGQDLKVKVGNQLHFADLATVRKGGKYTMDMDVNGTYREFQLTTAGTTRSAAPARGAAEECRNSMKLVLSSDECCDNSCITVKEVDGKFDVRKEPRGWRSSSSSSSTKSKKSIWTLWR